MKTVVLGEELGTLLLIWVLGSLWCTIWLLLCLNKGKWLTPNFFSSNPFDGTPPYSMTIFLVSIAWWMIIPITALEEFSKRIDVWARKKIALAKEKELDN